MAGFEVLEEIEKNRKEGFSNIPGKGDFMIYKEFVDDKPKERRSFFGFKKKQHHAQTMPTPEEIAKRMKLPKVIAVIGTKEVEIDFMRIQDFVNRQYSLGVVLDKIKFIEEKKENKESDNIEYPNLG